MQRVSVKFLAMFFAVFFSLLVFPQAFFGQERCLSKEEVQKAVALTEAPGNVNVDEALRQKLLDSQAAREELERKIIDNPDKSQKLVPELNAINKKNLLQLCEIVKERGWVRKELVGEDGMAAALSFLQGSQNTELQLQIFPVVAAAVKKGLVGNSNLAALVDGIRVGGGLPQIFGTQTKVKDELFYLYPLLNDARVDEWRKIYGLPPLSSFMKYLQSRYGMPVIKMPRLPSPSQLKDPATLPEPANAKTESLVDLENDEVIKVESNVVNLNVRVSSNDPLTNNLNLQKSDFALFADGKPQEISFFSTRETPFDLVLLLDLSGSTSEKQDLIRKSTQRFIEAARPSDRIAIVAFSDEPKIVSDLTSDKTELLKSVKKIDDLGGSGVWRALQFAYQKIIKPESEGRRSAIIIMTDGVDTALLPNRMMPESYPNFSDVLEMVRTRDTTVIPIYLDTENDAGNSEEKSYRIARRTLALLAEESGGQVYNAKKVKDLNGVYQEVINDLGKVYSLGYEPTDIKADGTWHSLTVTIPKYPNLTIRAKKGFYAR